MREKLPERSASGALPQLAEAREETVRALSAHFAADHLDVAELERRLDLVFRTRTRGELQTLLADLPALREPVEGETLPAARVEPGRSVAKNQTMVAVMGGAERKGEWTPPRHLNVVAMMGGAGLDFREARFGEPVTEVTVVAFMGGVEIIVPPGVRVESNGIAIMGGFEQMSADTAGPDAPLVKVNGFVMMAAAEIKVRLPGESERQARKRRKEEQKRKTLKGGGS